MTTKRYKSVLCGLLILAIAIHPEQHHIEEKHPRIHLQTRRQRKYWRNKARHESA